MPRLPRRIAAGTATGTRGAAALRLVAPAPRAQLGGMAAAAASRSVAGVAAADVHRRQQQRNQQVLATVSRGVDQLGTSLRRCSLLHPEREGGREHRLRRVSNAFRMTTDGGPPRPACPAQLHSDAQDGRLPLRVVTFDLDDTLWPTGEVVFSANAALRAWLGDHFPGIENEGVEVQVRMGPRPVHRAHGVSKVCAG